MLRYDIGTDYSACLIIFDHPEIMSSREVGFMMINRVVKLMRGSFQTVVMIKDSGAYLPIQFTWRSSLEKMDYLLF